MNSISLSAANLSRFFAVLLGLALLTCCGGGSSSTNTNTGTPGVSLSVSSLTFSTGVGVASAPQSVTVSNTGTATLTFSGISISNAVFAQTNTCGTGIAAGSTCTISVIFTPTALDPPSSPATGTLSIADNASGSPQTVSLSGTSASVSASPTSLSFTGVAVNTTSAAQTVTLSNGTSSAVAISSITTTTAFGETNTCGSSIAANGSCTISVTFTPQASGTTTGTLTIADGAGTQAVSLSGSTAVTNTAQVTIGFGPNGGGAVTVTSAPYFNGIFTSVTVCAPGSTTNCTTIPNILVDTDSVGLRVLSTALGSVSLPTVTDTGGDALDECYEYGSLDYTWGPVAMATVNIAGESASQVPASAGGTGANTGIPIQVITTASAPPTETVVGNSIYPTPCLSGGGINLNTVALLGSNGILGIGLFPQDCSYAGGNFCTTYNNDTLYVLCPGGTCQAASVPAANQVWNPVAAFPADNNGVSLQLPFIPSAGAASNTVNGTLTFGIGTQSNNALGSATVYEADTNGDFASATYNGVSYTSTNSGGGFIDSGSNALFISDETTLGTTDCLINGSDIGFYCPSSNLNLSLGIAGANGTNTTVTLPVENALNTLFPTGNAAFNDLAGPSCIPVTNSPCSASADSWDLGLPFFYNRTIFVGIEGSSTTYPNGYWAF